MKLKIIAVVVAVTILEACSQVPLTGRSQISLVDEGQMLSLAQSSYTEFLKENKVVANTSKDAVFVKKVGNNLIEAVKKFMNEKGYGDQIKDYKWEVNLVESKELNAWCMPGGKIVVYTGILPVTKDETGLATVMGHEIAHAIARHGAERMSQQMAVEYGAAIGSTALSKNTQNQQVFNQLYGVGAPIVLLKYGRNQESEADRLGLSFMAVAGYDPRKAVDFWQRMSASSQGQQRPPEWLSTHPSDETRIAGIQKYLPEALSYYKK
ncbi:M48 family metallopeptidase [Solitalea canadensis]|uniref:Peptidase family M48 n=1 Tax=Solitalea canadensis (strain ATCC 29591 / DSM 3403 / JCM 21819 / LMG 8368 / NBRC 15130 / NCIMB 12057 / USAM 9D) TaxID=929556 RepID=H8KRG8_SOLCM|nr:M48 family metallopeptidase [Solitalea canadensis]AFD07493.1 Peptidase family M48 [Solitalea canadensis DSM 3403]